MYGWEDVPSTWYGKGRYVFDGATALQHARTISAGPRGGVPREGDTQWRRALGPDNVLVIEDEARAVDCAMGIVARSWGRLEDFQANLLARQSEETVTRLSAWIQRHGPRAFGRYQCSHCGSTLVV